LKPSVGNENTVYHQPLRIADEKSATKGKSDNRKPFKIKNRRKSKGVKSPL